jgi:hypothetical protein
MPVIPVTQEVEAGEPHSENNRDESTRSYLKKN